MPASREEKREYQRQYYKANREKVLARQARYKALNPEKVAAQQRASQRRYYKANVKKALEYNRRWRKANPEKQAAMDRRNRKAHAERIREMARERNRRWRERNPEKSREKWHKWRARKLAMPFIDHVPVMPRDRCCPDCGVKMVGRGHMSNAPSIDHIVSLYRGGHHVPSNTRIICFSCNSAKRILDLAEWHKHCPSKIGGVQLCLPLS